MKSNTCWLAKVRLAKVGLASKVHQHKVSKKSHLSAGSKRVIIVNLTYLIVYTYRILHQLSPCRPSFDCSSWEPADCRSSGSLAEAEQPDGSGNAAALLELPGHRSIDSTAATALSTPGAGLFHHLWLVLLDCSKLAAVTGSTEHFECSSLAGLRLERRSIAGNRLHSLLLSIEPKPVHSVAVAGTEARHWRMLPGLQMLDHMHSGSESRELAYFETFNCCSLVALRSHLDSCWMWQSVPVSAHSQHCMGSCTNCLQKLG